MSLSRDPEGEAVASRGDIPQKGDVMRYLLTTTLLATALALPLAGTASAQRINEDVMSRCNQSVGQLKFEGWPADRNREMMMAACRHAGGIVPGAQQERPASLRNGPARQR
jgi:hypothetical protein